MFQIAVNTEIFGIVINIILFQRFKLYQNFVNIFMKSIPNLRDTKRPT